MSRRTIAERLRRRASRAAATWRVVANQLRGGAPDRYDRVMNRKNEKAVERAAGGAAVESEEEFLAKMPSLRNFRQAFHKAMVAQEAEEDARPKAFDPHAGEAVVDVVDADDKHMLP
jgi:hypothetical protein